MTSRRTRPLLLAGLLAVACSVTVPVLLPPPFDETGQKRLLLPTGMTVAPSGHLLVVSSNLDRTYDSGTLMSIDPAWTNARFARTDPSVEIADDLPDQNQLNAVMIPDYAGPVALDTVGNAWVGSRTTNLATAVKLDPSSGELSCVVGGGRDCRRGTLNMLNVKLEGPYGVAAGVARLPGQDRSAPDVPVMFISSLVPHVDDIINNSLQTYGRVSAVSVADPTSVLFTMDVSPPPAGIGAGTIVFDASRKQLILGGCYQRFTAGSAGDAATGKCSGRGSNPIRFVDVTAGSEGNVRSFDLIATVGGNETTSLVLGGFSGGVPSVLYATSRNPDVVVEIALPSIPGQDPLVRRAVPLPVSPSTALLIRRPAGQTGDLLAITGSGNGTVSIYDAAAAQVVGQVNGLGDYPFALAQLPDAVPADGRARLVSTVFGECRLAFVDLPYAQPWNARLRAKMGKCK